MARYLVYDEYINENESYQVKKTEQEAIDSMVKYAKEHHDYTYKDSKDALDDYISLHWAYWKEEL